MNTTNQEATEEQILPPGKREKYERYAKLIEERDELEEAIKALGVQVKADIESQDLQKAYLPGYGTFSVILVPRYKYSEKVEEVEAKVKTMKEYERDNGIAESQATSSLRFTKAK